MEITELPGTIPLSLPLPIYMAVPLAVASANGEEFDIVAGLKESYVEEVKMLSLDDGDVELMENTSDRRRFGETPYEEWYAKDRTPFALIHKETDTLAALVWLGPQPIGKKNLENLSGLESDTDDKKESGEWHTIAWRSYVPFRGKGLMKDFARFAMKIYSASRPGVHYWAGTKPENGVSIALASSLGFTISEENSDRANDWLVMVK